MFLKKVGVINATSFNHALKEWKFCKFELEKIAGKTGWTAHPAQCTNILVMLTEI
jgi:hypothetical protein